MRGVAKPGNSVYFDAMNDNDSEVTWNDGYSVGVPLIDAQHKELVRMTNDLFQSCLKGRETAEISFMKTVQGAAAYAKTHFGTEEQILEPLDYPGYAVHKKQHEDFVADVLRIIRDFEGGKKMSPKDLARFLRDWVLNHIAGSDKEYAYFLDDLKNQGKVDNESLEAMVEI
jgi:hemerythrin